jgi:hypothetical protein
MPNNLSFFGLQDGNKSIYDGQTLSSVSITGAGSGPGSGIYPSACPDPIMECTDTVALNQFLELIKNLYDIIEESFPSANTKAPIIAQYKVGARANPFTFVRFAWIKANPGQKLYPSISAALAIKDLYLANGLDWTTDPLILTYLPI